MNTSEIGITTGGGVSGSRRLTESGNTRDAADSTVSRSAQLEIQETNHTVQGDQHIGVRRVLTYGTFDLLHYGHIRLLQRAKALGDYLVVALSTDEFNAEKGKKSFYPYEMRKEMLEAIRYVDLVIPEQSWDQKRSDIHDYHIDVLCMGDDWAGSNRFEYLRDECELIYLSRTSGISTTDVKERLAHQ